MRKEYEKSIDGNSGEIYGEDVEKGFHVIGKPCQEGEVGMDPKGDSIPMQNLNLKNTEAIISTPNDFNNV